MEVKVWPIAIWVEKPENLSEMIGNARLFEWIIWRVYQAYPQNVYWGF